MSETPSSEPGKPAPQPPAGIVDAETFLVLAAATAAVLRDEHRIIAVSVPTGTTTAQPFLVWSLEGRRQIYSSHRVRQ